MLRSSGRKTVQKGSTMRGGAALRKPEKQVQRLNNNRIKSSGTQARTNMPQGSAASVQTNRTRAAAPQRKSGAYFDYSLFSAVLLIFAIGLIVIYSSSQYMALHEKGTASFYMTKQLKYGGTALILGLLTTKIDYKILKGPVSRLGYWGCIGLLLATIIVGIASHGKTRWMLLMGQSFQPTEFAKIGLILLFSTYVSQHGPNMNKPEHIWRSICIGALPAAIIATQNISSGIIVAMMTAIMLFVAIDNYKVFYALLAAAGVTVAGLKPLLHYIIIQAGITESPSKYYLKRIVGWAAPEIFGTDAYQTVQGLYAIGSGGIIGHGLGESIQKYGAIPEVQNDMIFTIVCEEFGVLGAAFIIILYIYILYRIYNIAVNARDLFGTMICTGVMAHLGLQAVLNIAVVTAVIPNTGVTLPFISYGGSAIVSTMLEIALVLNVAKRIRV